ncbi:hypothetical protein V8V50_10525 [Ligilactobacillus salivarius]
MVKKLVFPGEDINNFDFEALWDVAEMNDDEKVLLTLAQAKMKAYNLH